MGLGPGFKASEGKGLWQGAGHPELEYRPDWAGRGRRQLCLQQTWEEEKRAEPFQTQECGTEAQTCGNLQV